MFLLPGEQIGTDTILFKHATYCKVSCFKPYLPYYTKRKRKHSGMTLVLTEVGNWQCITSLPNVYEETIVKIFFKMTKIDYVIFPGLRKHTLLGRPLGAKAFIAKLGRKAGGIVSVLSRGRPKKQSRNK